MDGEFGGVAERVPAEGAELCGNRGERRKRGCGYLFHSINVYGYFRHQNVHGEGGVSAKYGIRGSENREPERTEHLNGVAVLGTSEGRGKMVVFAWSKGLDT